jgi:dienelactone hydrolase
VRTPGWTRRRQRALAAACLLVAALARWGPATALSVSPTSALGTGGQEAAPSRLSVGSHPRFAVGVRVLRLVDRSRTIRLGDGVSEPRTLVTYVRYPALGAPADTDMPNARPATADGPFPLIVFAHGFAVTPATYARLLQSWAHAGYVVAAPVFPLSNAHAPNGPDESDIVNQPRDMSFVISRLLESSGAAAGPLAGLIEPDRVAVAGQSDGGETALAVAYSRRFRDPRVIAAVILSGAEMSGVGGYTFAPGGPALLAAQGTADTSNQPRFTYAFFRAAPRPKYLLRLLSAQHLPPYTRQQPQLTLVERVSTAFFDTYLNNNPAPLAELESLGRVPGISTLVADP